MNQPSPPSTAAAIAIGALSACGYVGGWLILLLGGFHHAPYRYTRETTFVAGAPAMAMAAVFFALAGIGVVALLQARRAKTQWQVIACGAVLLPPVYFAVFCQGP
jgi:arginine exporter protein ArgO